MNLIFTFFLYFFCQCNCLQNYLVSVDGVDRPNCGDINKPCASISYTLKLASTLPNEAGIYSFSFYLSKGFNINNCLQLSSHSVVVTLKDDNVFNKTEDCNFQVLNSSSRMILVIGLNSTLDCGGIHNFDSQIVLGFKLIIYLFAKVEIIMSICYIFT